jgi:hypothetical protein
LDIYDPSSIIVNVIAKSSWYQTIKKHHF